MSKKKNTFIIALFLIAAGGFYISQNIMGWARTQAEKIATESLGVPVSVGPIAVSIKDKSIRIAGIKIGNPKGYDGPYAVKLGLIEAQADILSREKIVIKKVSVADNDINIEMVGTKTNLSALSSGIKSKPASKSSESAKAPTVNIKELTIADTALHIHSDLVKDQGALSMPLIRLKNVGQDNNQASAVVAQITRAVLNEALSVAAKNGILQNLSNEAVKGLKTGLGKGTDSFKKSLEGIKLKKD